MLILRIANGVIDHFPVRRSEWISSFVMIGWGLVLALDGRPLYGNWSYLSISLSETAWWGMCISLGVLRLIILTINGTFPQSWYGRWSPHSRIAISLLCTLMWLQLVLAGMKADVWSTGVVAYAGYFVSDMLNTWSSAAEARELDKGRKNVAAGTIDARELARDSSYRRWLGHWRRYRLRAKKSDGSQPNQGD